MHSFHLRGFDDERNFGKAGVVEDIRECWRADIALADVLVPVHSALIGRFRVVEMKSF